MFSSNKILEVGCFFIILAFFSLAFLNIMLPFFSAIFWAVVLAVLFSPVQRRLERHLRKNLATFVTILCCILIVVLPVLFVANSLFQEGTALLDRVRTGHLDFGVYLQHITDSLPVSARNLLDRVGWTGDLTDIRAKLSQFAMHASQYIATQVYSVGQITFQFVISLCIMLYLLFFFLRDGAWLATKIDEAIPLSDRPKGDLFSKFTTVIVATVKGSIIVAIIQGTLGGIAFWCLGIQGAVLWGVIMSVMSLLPAVGSSIVWAPVAIYFLLTGMVWQGIGLCIFGILVISLVDSLLRPILVGKDTKLPDWVIMLSTLGGMASFGLNGFVLGPLIAAMFVAVWAVLTERRVASSGDI